MPQLVSVGGLMSPVQAAGTGAVPPVVTTYILDTFTEASDTSLVSHVSDDGKTWAVLTGATGVYTVIGGAGDIRSTTVNPRYMSSATTPDDFIAELIMRRFSSVVNDQAGAYLNMTAASTNAAITGYRFRFNNATLALELDKLTASVLTQAIISFSYTPTAGDHTYKLTKVGTAFEIFVDGVSVATGTDAGVAFIGGRVGVVGGTTTTAATGTHISNLYVHN